MSRPDLRPLRSRARRRLPRSLAAAGLVAWGAVGGAAGAPPAAEAGPPAAASAGLPTRDRELGAAIRAAHGRIIRLAERALRFTPTPDVLVLAHEVLADHQRLAAELERLVPGEAGPVETPARLEGKVNEEFDQAFLGDLAEEHERALTLLAGAVQHAEAPVLRAYATEAVVVLDRNLRQVRELRRRSD